MDYDVIIIGTRVAGSILGSHLGEMGHSVLAIDRAKFPSDTLSTHFFRAPALRAFEFLGLEQEIEKQAPKLRVNYNVIDGIAFPEPVDRPEDFPYYMNIRRIVLDQILHTRLKETDNVHTEEGALAKKILWEDDGAIGLQWENASGIHESYSRAVIGADGVRSFTAKQANAQYEHRDPVTRTMYYAYYSGLEANEGPAAEFHYSGNEIAYWMPTDSDLTLLAVSSPIDHFKQFKRDPEKVLHSKLNQMVHIKDRLSSGKLESRVQGTGSIFSFKRKPFGQGWALVGDAAMTLDPWSGQGIDQGSSHALILGRHLDTFLTGNRSWEKAMEGYHQERNEFSDKAYRQTTSYSRDLRPMTTAALKKRGLI